MGDTLEGETGGKTDAKKLKNDVDYFHLLFPLFPNCSPRSASSPNVPVFPFPFPLYLRFCSGFPILLAAGLQNSNPIWTPLVVFGPRPRGQTISVKTVYYMFEKHPKNILTCQHLLRKSLFSTDRENRGFRLSSHGGPIGF